MQTQLHRLSCISFHLIILGWIWNGTVRWTKLIGIYILPQQLSCILIDAMAVVDYVKKVIHWIYWILYFAFFIMKSRGRLLGRLNWPKVFRYFFPWTFQWFLFELLRIVVLSEYYKINLLLNHCWNG